MKTPFQFLIDVRDDDVLTRALASYDKAAPVTVTAKLFSIRSGDELSQIDALTGLRFMSGVGE